MKNKSEEKEYLVRFDYAIKKLLRDKKNFAILEGFIEVFLNRTCKILEILESESNQESQDDKFNRVDIKAKDYSGEIFIVEVQTTRYTYYLERILYGVSKAITEQMKIGGEYGDIKQVYSISLVYYDLGKGDDYFYECKSDFYGVHTHNILKLNRREQLSVEEIANGDKRNFKYVEKQASDIFPKYYLIRINAFREIIATAMDEWMQFLKNNSIKKDTQVPGLKEAKEQLKYEKMSESEKLGYKRHLESVVNEQEAMSTSKEEGINLGIQKGIEIGKEEGLLEGKEIGLLEGAKNEKIAIAKNLKHNLKLSNSEIANVTGLTTEEIDKL